MRIPAHIHRASIGVTSSLKQAPFLGPENSTAAFYKKDPKRDPNLENYPLILASATLQSEGKDGSDHC